MNNPLTFDEAIDILEITDITRITTADIPKIEKKARIRWHPDRVSHLENEAETRKYTRNFQNIDEACAIIYNFLNGTYRAGEKAHYKEPPTYQAPEEVILKNAPDMQATLRGIWQRVKNTKFKLTTEEVILSDGFKLRDLLKQDFDEDLAMLSVVSFFYGLLFSGILVAIGFAINPVIGDILSIFALLQSLSCIVGFLPLSRFWLPLKIQEPMIWLINLGLKIYTAAENTSDRYDNVWVKLAVRLPNILARGIKYIILLPLYELAKVFVGDKVVGVVKKKVDYYAGLADWYINDLITNDPNNFKSDDLFNLSYIYGELKDVPQQQESYSEAQPKNKEEKRDFHQKKEKENTSGFPAEEHVEPKRETYSETKTVSSQASTITKENVHRRKRAILSMIFIAIVIIGASSFFLYSNHYLDALLPSKNSNTVVNPKPITSVPHKIVLTKNYAGNVGTAKTAWVITWRANNTIEGHYLFTSGKSLQFSGNEISNGGLRFTIMNGKEKYGIGSLDKQGDCFSGKIYPQKGSPVSIKICLK